MAQGVNQPIVANLENYGRKVIIPVRVIEVLDKSFVSHFSVDYPTLYMDSMRGTMLRYEFHENGAMMSYLLQESMKEYSTTHDTHVTTLKTSAYLRSGDILLCGDKN